VGSGVPADTKAWVERQVGGRVVRAERLRGGITSSVHALHVEAPSGARTSVVLRRWTDAPPPYQADALDREARVLRLLEPTPVAAPVLLGTSDGADTDGTVALLMSRLPGRIDLAPRDPAGWVRQMARALAELQALGFAFPTYKPTPMPVPEVDLPWWTTPSIWRAALEALRAPAPTTPLCFTHGDYQHFNLLWSRGKLSGIVDWAHPVVSSPDLDVGHCRLNLTILFGWERAELFRQAYEAEASRQCEPWWDLLRLTSYDPDWQRSIPIQVAGRIAVDVDGMTRRVEEGLAVTLARL
jgi:aminoglycoside phosphotransferase (APT) family kinase protein